MVLKFWDVDKGKVTNLKYTNSKNESMLLKLKVPIEPDRIPLSRMNDAFELITEFVSSIKKFDDSGALNSGKDGKVEAKPEIKVEAKTDGNIEDKPEIKVEISTLEEEYDKDNGKEVPKEVSDKLNLLLQEDEGRRDGAQFLININAKKGAGNDKSPLHLPSSKPDIIVVPNEDIVSEEKSKTEKKQRYSGYGEAIVKCVPKILEDIASSNDAKVLINASDLAKRMGEEFADIDPSLLDSNVRYKFFDHGLIMTMLSSDDTDTYVGKGEKVFRFRLKHDHDKLPDSILKQRNELCANEIDA